MKNIFQFLQLLFISIQNFLDNISRPNLKYAKSHVDFELTHKRIKIAIIFHSLLDLFVLAQLFGGKTQSDTALNLVLLHTAYVIILISFRSSHPQVLQIFYHILLWVSIFILATDNDDGIHRVCLLVTLYPNLLFLFTGSIAHFSVHTIIHIIYIFYAYRPALVETIKKTPTEDLAHMIATFSVKEVIFNMIAVICIQSQLQAAYKKVNAAERTEVEFERQKIFLLGFSHELRNLLNSLMGNVKLASLERLNDGAKEYLQNANLCGELLLHLVNNILDTGKAEIGDLEVNPVSANACEVFGKIWSVCSDVIKRKNLRGTMKIQRGIPQMLKIDHYRLMQVILNLVGNSVKFTDSGSINITLEWLKHPVGIDNSCFEPCPYNDQDEFSEGTFERDICFSTFIEDVLTLNLSSKEVDASYFEQSKKATSGVLKIIVGDTGCGISSEDRPKLFQKFSQVGTENSRRKLGTGLGLFITKQICEKMKGEIRVYSKKNKGSCFVVCIPVDALPVTNLNHQFISQGNILRKIDYLQGIEAMVVDDDRLSSLTLKAFLGKLRIKVVDVAYNGLEGYNKYLSHINRNTRPKIIIMDLEMPIMDGKKASEQIRELERSRGVQPCLLIVISGNCSASEIEECVDPNRKIKANVFLKKPASMEDIARAISEHIQEGEFARE